MKKMMIIMKMKKTTTIEMKDQLEKVVKNLVIKSNHPMM